MFSLFRHNQPSPVPCQLRIEGIAPAPLTPDADEAEKAAEAFIASLEAKNEKMKKCKNEKGRQPEKGTAEYYKQLAERIKEKQAEEARAALRYVAYCEEQLAKNEKMKELKNEKDSSLFTLHSSLEAGLYRHMDVVDRAGGDLKRRWQHCLADVTVRLMRGGASVV